MKDIEGSNTWGLKLITSLMKELETVMLIVTITTSQGLKPMASWVRLMTDTKLEASQVPISQSFTKTMKENKKQIRQSYNSWVGAPGLPGAGSYMFHNVHEDVIKKYFGAPKTFTNEGFRSPGSSDLWTVIRTQIRPSCATMFTDVFRVLPYIALWEARWMKLVIMIMIRCWWWWINALCGYLHVKLSIRDLNQISTTAPLFQQ